MIPLSEHSRSFEKKKKKSKVQESVHKIVSVAITLLSISAAQQKTSQVAERKVEAKCFSDKNLKSAKITK